MRVLSILLTTFLSIATPLAAAGEQQAIRELLADPNTRAVAGVGALYTGRDYEPLWVVGGKLTAQARQLVGEFSTAERKGLHSADYGGGTWNVRLRGLSAAENRARVDLAITNTAMRYVSDLHVGRFDPRSELMDYDVSARAAEVPALLEAIASADDASSAITAVEPLAADYRRLRAVLPRYRRIAAEADQPKLLFVKPVKPGESYISLSVLSKFLLRTGDLRQPFTARTYSGELVQAVRRFQRRHGMRDDGVLNAATVQEMNVPLGWRVRQLEMALERWRWVPPVNGRAIIVNIPEFRLRGIDESRSSLLSMRVVVGEAYLHNTPIFDSSITQLIFRPQWNVPTSIQHAEIVPKLGRDRGYLARNGYEAVGAGGAAASAVNDRVLADLKAGRMRLRQKPGTQNSLGLLKFVLPKNNDVYLHDTPARQYFAQVRRDFSHGCIRVEQPAALAAWVLGEKSGWTEAKIRAAMTSGPTRELPVPAPVPVSITYITAVVAEDGEVQFFPDIYGYDMRLQRELARRYPGASYDVVPEEVRSTPRPADRPSSDEVSP